MRPEPGGRQRASGSETTGLHRLCAWFVLVLLAAVPASAQESPWILVDTRTQVLSVMQDGREVDRFEHLAIGRGGASELRRKGDGSTPLGTFRVAWINEDSPFRRFYGFDFPTLDVAQAARKAGTLTEEEFGRIERAVRAGELPPQNTTLGGRLGIHGLGNANPRVHRDFNWTRGCIALTNDQIDRLSRWIAVGTRVVVR